MKLRALSLATVMAVTSFGIQAEGHWSKDTLRSMKKAAALGGVVSEINNTAFGATDKNNKMIGAASTHAFNLLATALEEGDHLNDFRKLARVLNKEYNKEGVANWECLKFETKAEGEDDNAANKIDKAKIVRIINHLVKEVGHKTLDKVAGKHLNGDAKRLHRRGARVVYYPAVDTAANIVEGYVQNWLKEEADQDGKTCVDRVKDGLKTTFVKGAFEMLVAEIIGELIIRGAESNEDVSITDLIPNIQMPQLVKAAK